MADYIPRQFTFTQAVTHLSSNLDQSINYVDRSQRANYYTTLPQYVVCLSVRLSVRPSVTFRYRDHIGWNTSKIILRPNSLGLS